MALTLLRLRTTSITRSTSCNVSRRTTVSLSHRKVSDEASSRFISESATLVVVAALGGTSVSIHPQSPSFSIQQHAKSPARPTPPRQCTNTETPCREYPSMIRSRSASRDLGESGVRPSGRGILRTGGSYQRERRDMQWGMRTAGHRDLLDVQLGSIRSTRRLLGIQVPRRRDSFGVQQRHYMCRRSGRTEYTTRHIAPRAISSFADRYPDLGRPHSVLAEVHSIVLVGEGKEREYRRKTIERKN
jgi:hypothetical protein